MLAALLMALTTVPKDPNFSAWGLETLQMIRTKFFSQEIPGYVDAIGNGAQEQPAFNWGVVVLLSAMNAAARSDPAWKKELRQFVGACQSYWNPAGPVPGYDVLPMPKQSDRYYDDNAWMALALTESSQVLNDAKILKHARRALEFVLSGQDDRLGGGIYWREEKKQSKNTCANAPAVAACLALYRLTGEHALLESARSLYSWTKANLQDPSDDLFWDSVSLSGKIGRTKWSYNTALMIRSAAELGEITGEHSYTADAERMAVASEKKWLVKGRFADVGRFAHLLVESWTYVPDAARMKRARAALVWLHDHGRNKNGLYASRFDNPPDESQQTFELIDQASAARAYFVVSQ